MCCGLSLDDILELKQDIKCLDKKLDKNEENMNKRLEKNEDNMNKFMEVVGASISKLTEAMTEMKLAMVKDYIEKEELEKVETNLNKKIDINNDNRKQDIRNTNIRVDGLERDNSLKIPDIIRKIIYLALGGGVALLGTKVFGS
jgi:hypothetical protein